MSNEKPQENRLHPDKTTLAKRIDNAFAILAGQDSDDQKKKAMSFLIYAFDIREKDPEKIERKIRDLMAQRNQERSKNPEYIPGKTPRQLKLDSEQLLPKKTIIPGQTSDTKINDLIANKEILDVVHHAKKEDQLSGTTMLTPEKRNEYRVLMSNGLLVQDEKPFDTSEMTSHSKKGWGAFTLNINGELSIFEHLHGERNAKREILLHSSMNAGIPVFAAGELKIEKGKLIAINTYSGHYFPTVHNIYRMLQHLSENDIDISEAKVYTHESLRNFDIPCTNVEGEFNDKYTKYESSAQSLYKVVDTSLSHAVVFARRNADQYSKLDNFWNHAKDFFTGSTLTKDREQLASAMAQEMQAFYTSIKDIKTDFQLACKMEELEKKLDSYELRNNALSERNDKEENTGRLAQKIRDAKHKLAEMKRVTPEDELKDDRENMKNFC